MERRLCHNGPVRRFRGIIALMRHGNDLVSEPQCKSNLSRTGQKRCYSHDWLNSTLIADLNPLSHREKFYIRYRVTLPACKVSSLSARLSPTFQNVSAKVALIAALTGLNLATDYMLTGFPNVKFMDAFYFIATLEFGLSVGLPIVVFTRTAYAIVNPLGVAPGFLIPFLIAGDSIYVLSGYLARRFRLIEKE